MERLGEGLFQNPWDDIDLNCTLQHQNNRTRESSVVISPQWSMLEEIEFHRLSKLRLEVDEPENLFAPQINFYRAQVLTIV